MSSNDCNGYHWSQGQYIVSNCNPNSSIFFIVLGFTMLVLMILLFIIVVIACVRRHRLRAMFRQSPPMASQGSEDGCVVNLEGIGPIGGSLNGKNLENVKCVIMAGEEKPTFIAHLVKPRPPSSSDSIPVEEEGGQEVVYPGGRVSSGQPALHSQEES